MKTIFSVCDKCGRIMTDPLNYKIVTKRYKLFNGFIDDEEYSYCQNCYTEITNKLNEQSSQATKKLNRFIKALEASISKGVNNE